MLGHGPMHEPGAERRRAERGSHRKPAPRRQGVEANGSQRPHREVIDWRVIEHDEGRSGDTVVQSRPWNQQSLLPDNAFAVVETKRVAHGVEGVAQINRRADRQDADEQHCRAKRHEPQSSAVIQMPQPAKLVRSDATLFGFLAHGPSLRGCTPRKARELQSWWHIGRSACAYRLRSTRIAPSSARIW